MFESLTTSYLESTAAKFPAQRAALFVLGFIVSIEFSKSISFGMVNLICNFNLSNFAYPNNLPLRSATLGSILFGVAFVIVGAELVRTTIAAFFFLANRTTNFRRKIRRLYGDQVRRATLSASDRQIEISITEGSLASIAKNVRRFSSLAEFCGASGLALLVFSLKTGPLDMLVGGLFVLVFILSAIRSVQIFISDYFSLAAYRNHLQGRGDPSLDEIGNA